MTLLTIEGSQLMPSRSEARARALLVAKLRERISCSAPFSSTPSGKIMRAVLNWVPEIISGKPEFGGSSRLRSKASLSAPQYILRRVPSRSAC